MSDIAEPSVSRTKAAFDIFRAEIGTPREPPAHLIRNDGELTLITEQDGLQHLADGTDLISSAREPRLIEKTELSETQLWVVRPEDVVYAEEYSAFGKKLPTGRLKHTNLTGGAPAFAGGELLKIDDILVINGCSGRYHPKSEDELSAVEKAFRDSGYRVWSMGYDQEADRPFPFLGVLPKCVR